MDEQLRALIVEDVEEDAQLLVRELERAFKVAFLRVDSSESMSAALEAQAWDIVIADYALPRFSAPMALALLKERHPELPLIVVSGRVGEETAVAALHAGARDFIGKGNLTRLNSAVERELRDRAAKAVQLRSQSALDAIMESSAATIVVLDERGRVRFTNGATTLANGEEIVGSDWLEEFPPGEREGHRERLRRVIGTGEKEAFGTTVIGPDGRTVWLSSHIGPMRLGGRIVGAVVVSHDVTELKRTQVESAAAQRWAAVGTLAAGIAHEINTPIQFVNDSVHFLRDSSRDLFELVDALQRIRHSAAEAAEASELRPAIEASLQIEDEVDLDYLRENVPKALERCIEGLERVRIIVRSMKEFAHPAQREMAPVDLNRAIQNTLTIARNEYKYVAELETAFGDLPPVTCHVNDINQVVLNLLVNSANAISEVVKGTDSKGRIGVRTWREGDQVVVSVSDTGAGIPDGIADRIFEPFFTTKEVGKGTGQGLALAWSVIKEKHKGELTFDSKAGAGTTFFVRLPIGDDDHAR